MEIDHGYQIDLAVSNALVQLVNLLVSKGVITAAEYHDAIEPHVAVFNDMQRPTAATFTRLMADAFGSESRK